MRRCDLKGNVCCPGRRAVQPASDADLCKGAEGCVPPALKAADGGEQSQHALLEQVLAVPSRQKQRAGAGTHQAAVAANQLLLSGGVPRPCQKAYFLVR